MSHPPSQLNTVCSVLVVYVTSLEYPLGQGVRVAGHDVRVDVRVTRMVEMTVVVKWLVPGPDDDGVSEVAAPEEDEEDEEALEDDVAVLGVMGVPAEKDDGEMVEMGGSPDRDIGMPVVDDDVVVVGVVNAAVESVAAVGDGGNVYSFDVPSVQDVTTTVEVEMVVEAPTRELLCLGLNTGASFGTLVGIALKVAEEGAMGPFRRAELTMLLL
ncbi:MAG: hypothetical protein Q9168_007017 [Polycauliona sp. 1 TL-2023]